MQNIFVIKHTKLSKIKVHIVFITENKGIESNQIGILMTII